MNLRGVNREMIAYSLTLHLFKSSLSCWLIAKDIFFTYMTNVLLEKCLFTFPFYHIFFAFKSLHILYLFRSFKCINEIFEWMYLKHFKCQMFINKIYLKTLINVLWNRKCVYVYIIMMFICTSITIKFIYLIKNNIYTVSLN